jgi:hypothetical protein
LQRLFCQRFTGGFPGCFDFSGCAIFGGIIQCLQGFLHCLAIGLDGVTGFGSDRSDALTLLVRQVQFFAEPSQQSGIAAATQSAPAAETAAGCTTGAAATATARTAFFRRPHRKRSHQQSCQKQGDGEGSRFHSVSFQIQVLYELFQNQFTR